MRILILSCNTGQGHNSVADAISAELAEWGAACEVVDSLSFISRGASELISDGHTYIYRHMPGLFRSGYKFTEKHEAVFQEDSPVYKFLIQGADRLYDFLRKGEYDAILCVHVFSALMLTNVRKNHDYAPRACFIATDYTCSPSLGESELDMYFIPDMSLAEGFAAAGLDPRKLRGSGIPVRREFSRSLGKARAKRLQGIRPDGRHLLMMCGSMGCGPMEQIVWSLSRGLRGGETLTVVCGTNHMLERRLLRLYSRQRNIRIRGYVSDVSALMDSADLYLTKPGGISVTEAAVKALPMVFVDAVAGCEEYNLDYFVTIGGAATARTPHKLARVSLELLSAPGTLAGMSRALRRCAHPNAAGEICDWLLGKESDDVGGCHGK